MKADHRHELKTNILADWIAHFPEWCQKNAKQLIGGTALVVVVVVAVMWSQYNNTVLAQAKHAKFTNDLATQELTVMQVAQTSSQGNDTSMLLGEAASALGKMAQNASSKHMSALAYIKQAESLREQTQFENGQPDTQTVSDRLDAAKANYRKALELAKGNTTLCALAQYGLGLCAEEAGQYSEAKAIYEAMIGNDAYKGTTGQASALARLEVVDSFQNTITFPYVEEEVAVAPDAQAAILPDILSVADSNTASILPEIGPSLPPVAAPNTPEDTNITE